MTTHRSADFSLRDAVRSASFTPRVSDVAQILELLADDDRKLVKAATRALARIPVDALPLARARLETARPPLRGRIAKLVGRLVGETEPDPAASLEGLLADADPKTRRTAVIALGKHPSVAAERALLAYFASEASAPHRPIVAEALGKVGGKKALEALRAYQPTDAKDLALADRALLTAERTLHRPEPSAIDVSAAPRAPMSVSFHCREGIESILAAELGAAWKAKAAAPGRVDAILGGALSDAFTARTWIHVAFPLHAREGPVEDAVAEALASPEAARIFETWTKGPPRFRIAFEGAGHRRASVWRIAKRVAETRPSLVNDPTDSVWEAVVRVQDGRTAVDLVPRKMDDPRFAYRVADLPAASHPTLAAAIVRIAGRDPDAVVWDPFCGSGLELVERARAGPYRSLWGTDHDARALGAAHANLGAAGVKDATLEQADATTHVVPNATLILTNPPYGARVEFGRARALLLRFVDHAARVLAPRGRLVWISPIPEETTQRAARAGLEQTYRQPLSTDLELQAFWKK